jgi:hypothetical protein
MPLILAIDSDRRQSEQLAALMRKSLKVELVQATSAGEGLHALRDRVPDLILTSPLLSPFDDGVLDEYLRELGAQAAHVQTVRIPVLSAVAKPSARSLFSLRRTKTPSTAPDGCDPKVFADEIAQYLARAQERRAAKASAPTVIASADAGRSPVVDSKTLVPIEDVALAAQEEDDPIVRDFASFTTQDDADDELPIYQPTATIQTFEIPEEPKPIARRQPEPIAVEQEPIVVRPMSILNLSEPTLIEPSQLIQTDPDDREPASVFLTEAMDRGPAPEPIDVAASPEPIDAVQPMVPIEVAQAPQPIAVSNPPAVVSHAAEPEHASAQPVSLSVEASAGTSATQRRPGTAPITSFETALAAIRAAWAAPPDARTAPAAPAKAPARPAQVEVDLTGDIDALEPLDRSQPQSEGLSSDESSRQRSPKARKNAPQAPQARAANGGPVQDEWGIFDPNQCGFSALVDKLDEVADPQDHPERPTKVRVISVG